MKAFVDTAHGLGVGVMMDVVLHHGAPSGNMLWDWDGGCMRGSADLYGSLFLSWKGGRQRADRQPGVQPLLVRIVRCHARGVAGPPEALHLVLGPRV